MLLAAAFLAQFPLADLRAPQLELKVSARLRQRGELPLRLLIIHSVENEELANL